MIKELVHDPILKSEPATAADLQTAQDLLETLTAHKEICVGMAANMIGVNKSIICFDNDGKYMIMLNPEIIKRSDPYETKESCLSLLGGPRDIKRYKKIRVPWAAHRSLSRTTPPGTRCTGHSIPRGSYGTAHRTAHIDPSRMVVRS